MLLQIRLIALPDTVGQRECNHITLKLDARNLTEFMKVSQATKISREGVFFEIKIWSKDKTEHYSICSASSVLDACGIGVSISMR